MYAMLHLKMLTGVVIHGMVGCNHAMLRERAGKQRRFANLGVLQLSRALGRIACPSAREMA
jgi:hypothetical protein